MKFNFINTLIINRIRNFEFLSKQDIFLKHWFRHLALQLDLK